MLRRTMSAIIRRSTTNLLRLGASIHTSTAPEFKDTGLYGFDILKSPEGFRRFVDEAIERSGELVTYISGMPSSEEIIRSMDEISDTVCSVVDSAELCRHTHPDREFVEEANKASMRINEYLHYLNTNHTLYSAVIKAEKDNLLCGTEAQRTAHSLRVDFEKGGIHLSADKLDRVNQLNIEICQLCRVFNENIIIDPGYVDIFPTSRIPKPLHHLAKPIYRSRSSTSTEFLKTRYNTREKGFRIATEPSTLSSVLQWASDSEVRQVAYVKGNSVPFANLGVLDKLIAARHEIAQMLGYKSYAEFAVHPNMAASPEVVMSFLLEMSEIVRPKADEEFKKIWDFKRERSGQINAELEAWDEAYFTGLMKTSAYSLDSSVVASYFPLLQCIEGLKVLVQLLFGVTLCNIPLAPGESWHPDVLKMLLHHPEEGDLGYLFLDLNSRTGKYPGSAHFAIKGGRRISETEYQLPVVALVCNFSGSCTPASVRLNHWEVETLFHEFGHALHSLLSRTDYQHFSGTRVVLDLAETPSNLFEYYAWDYRVLKKFARHYSTGETIPEKLVESIQRARKMFAATELQRQIFYALIDQTLHGEQLPLPVDTISIVADLKRRHTSWKHVEGTHWHTRFSHLLNYGAGYYSYLYAKCFAATIWEKLCRDDPLSLATGSALRARFLQHGGAKDPANLLNDLVGDGIIRYRDGGIIPETRSLCKEMGLEDG
ncbi:mitochondrial intermediate peptidase, mitochondrial isoform X2 [Diospyros lotus]|uniref:mitochondrial intermediate peptidase, mitochondrial isoform X2 n=1 Tax=Diospyros lotus TaxID=55363 RepID=UPI002255C4A2|nr:mitochondrial intermediate peptidase, mitochondrial isoform X2 [Diospyros lotus]